MRVVSMHTFPDVDNEIVLFIYVHRFHPSTIQGVTNLIVDFFSTGTETMHGQSIRLPFGR